MPHPTDISRASKDTLQLITEEGYRTGIAWDHECQEWIAVAKHDTEDRFYSVSAPAEERCVAMLADAVGIELDDG